MIQSSTMGFIPIPVRWGALWRTGMGCMTWQETCGNGVGIGMEVTAVIRRPTRVVLLRARIACFAAAVGAAARPPAGWRPAAPARRTPGTTPWGSAPSCPQASELTEPRGKRPQRWNRIEGRLLPWLSEGALGSALFLAQHGRGLHRSHRLPWLWHKQGRRFSMAGVVGRDSTNGSAAESQWKRKRGGFPRTILFVPSARL